MSAHPAHWAGEISSAAQAPGLCAKRCHRQAPPHRTHWITYDSASFVIHIQDQKASPSQPVYTFDEVTQYQLYAFPEFGRLKISIRPRSHEKSWTRKKILNTIGSSAAPCNVTAASTKADRLWRRISSHLAPQNLQDRAPSNLRACSDETLYARSSRHQYTMKILCFDENGSTITYNAETLRGSHIWTAMNLLTGLLLFQVCSTCTSLCFYRLPCTNISPDGSN